MNSRSACLVTFLCYISVIMILWAPSLAVAGVINLVPGYNVNVFTTLNFSSRAIAFDSALNLYAMDFSDDSSGSVRVYVLNPSDGYATRSLNTSYATEAWGTTGLFFNSSETQLFVSEPSYGLNAGLIRELDTTTFAITDNWSLPSFRLSLPKTLSTEMYAHQGPAK